LTNKIFLPVKVVTERYHQGFVKAHYKEKVVLNSAKCSVQPEFMLPK